MRKLSILFTFAILAATLSAFAAEPELKSPIPETWVVSACETWNTASAALILAGGDATVLAIPTESLQHPWIVLRRVPGGSIYIPDDAPFLVEAFDTMNEATSRFAALEAAKIPMLMTAASGQTLVVYARNAQRRRTSGH